MNQVARSVMDPKKKESVASRAKAFWIVKGDPEMKQIARQQDDLPLGALGSGSDYTPFLQHLGITSLNLLFFGEEGGGSYHSIYDSFDHYTHFLDSDFEYGVTLAKLAGRVILRFANADVLPFEFSKLAKRVDDYLKELQKLEEKMRDENEEKKSLIRDGSLDMVLDSKDVYVPPKVLPEIPYLNFSPLKNAATRLNASSERYQEASRIFGTGSPNISQQAREALNQILLGTEKVFLRTEGLPRRPWFRHQLYAPGEYTGYDVKTIPGVREAIEQGKWDEANHEIELVAKTVEALSAVIDQAVAVLKPEKAK